MATDCLVFITQAEGGHRPPPPACCLRVASAAPEARVTVTKGCVEGEGQPVLAAQGVELELTADHGAGS